MSYPYNNEKAGCEHSKDNKSTFLKGICQQCGWKCEHEQQEDYCCLDCGESTFADAVDYADYLHEQERDRKLEEEETK